MDSLGFEVIYGGDNASTRVENDPGKPVYKTVDDLNNLILSTLNKMVEYAESTHAEYEKCFTLSVNNGVVTMELNFNTKSSKYGGAVSAISKPCFK